MTNRSIREDGSEKASEGAAGTPGAEENVRGRSVFAVEIGPVGIVVRTAFLSETGQVLELPAVFPDMQYALAQIDELRRMVIDRFSEAAQVGARVIAAKTLGQKAAPAPADDGPAPDLHAQATAPLAA